MAKSNHKYRVTIYLGKELYHKFEGMAELLGVSIATLTRLMLDNGVQIAENLERMAKENGKQ